MLNAGVDGFGQVPVGSKGGISVAVVILETLVHACDETQIIGCVDKGVDNTGDAVLSKIVEKMGS
jgi:hypothetical protein